MEKNDVFKLFDLLEQLHSRKKIQRDARTAAIWLKTLEPWSYEQVREAALVRARANVFLPDPAELAAYLPRINRPPEASCSPQDDAYGRWISLYHRTVQAECAARGIAPFRGRTGAEYAQWRGSCERAGIDFDRILAASYRATHSEAR